MVIKERSIVDINPFEYRSKVSFLEAAVSSLELLADKGGKFKPRFGEAIILQFTHSQKGNRRLLNRG